MDETHPASSKYHVEIRDARGVVIGDNNVVYQYFRDERDSPLAEHLIAERTADFVGRTFLDVRLATFMEQHDHGHFVLVGEPGIGEKAWAAHIVREYQAHTISMSARWALSGPSSAKRIPARNPSPISNLINSI